MFPHSTAAGMPDTVPLSLQAFALQPCVPSFHVREGVSLWEIYLTACSAPWCRVGDGCPKQG